MKPPKLADQKKLVEKFNRSYSVGEKIQVKLDNDEVVTWTIKHPATIMGGHTAVIWAEEHPGAYLASRVIFEKASATRKKKQSDAAERSVATEAQ